MNIPGIYVAPSVETHIPEKGELPKEEERLIADRPDAPTPSLWQRAVKVRHRVTGEPAMVVNPQWATCQFRAYYTDRLDPITGVKGTYGNRTQFESFDRWEVETTFSPLELERQAAAASLAEEIASMTEQERALVSVWCDDPDPNKNVAKLQALRVAGMIKSAGPKAKK
jgi:hypothetical protein